MVSILTVGRVPSIGPSLGSIEVSLVLRSARRGGRAGTMAAPRPLGYGYAIAGRGERGVPPRGYGDASNGRAGVSGRVPPSARGASLNAKHGARGAEGPIGHLREEKRASDG